MLTRYHRGEKKVWSVVYIPSVEVEDERHLHRTLITLNADRTRLLNRLKGLLSTQGVYLAVGTEFQEGLQDLLLWDGSPVRPGLQARLQREYALLKAVEEQIRDVEAERREALRRSTTASVAQVLYWPKTLHAPIRTTEDGSCRAPTMPEGTP